MKIVKGWVTDAKVCRSPNYNERPAGVTVSLLVIHNISLPPGCFDNHYIECFFQNSLPSDDHPYFESIKDLQVSSHFLIKRTGEVVQFVSCDDRAWHAGVSEFEGRDNCNDYSIGIELEGADDVEYTDSQYEKLSELTLAIQNTYSMINIDRIVGHQDIAPGRKTDPGSAFDWSAYRESISS